MIIELSDCAITYDKNWDTIPENLNERLNTHLANEKWAIILVTETPAACAYHLTDFYFYSVITICVKLHADNAIWMVPLNTLIDPCFVVYNKNYCQNQDIDIVVDDRTSYVVESMQKWGKLFLPWQ